MNPHSKTFNFQALWATYSLTLTSTSVDQIFQAWNNSLQFKCANRRNTRSFNILKATQVRRKMTRLIFVLIFASLLAIVTHSAARTEAEEFGLTTQEYNLYVVSKGDGYKRYLNLTGMSIC